MSNYKTLILGLAVLLMFGMMSCKDNSTNTTPTYTPSDYYKFTTGSYWVYQTDSLDASGNAISGFMGIDSVVSAAQEQISGQLAFHLVHDYKNGKTGDTYYYQDSAKLYGSIANMSIGPFSLPALGWLLNADFNGTTWNMFDTTITFPITYLGTTSQVPLHIIIKGTKGLTSLHTVNSTSVTCQDFTLNISAAGTFSGIIPIGAAITTTLSFAPKIGLVETTQNGFAITAAGQTAYSFNGYREVLLRYSVH